MFEKAAGCIIARSIQNGQIKASESEEYIYGLNLFLTSALNIVSMLVIGVLMRMPVQCIAFCCIFRGLRKYTGGYHADSPYTCYVMTCMMHIAVLLFLRYVPYFRWGMSAAVVLSVIGLMILSPIDAVTKLLDEDERRVFGRKARIFTVCVAGFYVAAAVIGWDPAANLLGISLCMVMIFAIPGVIKLKAYKRKQQHVV